MAKNNLYREKTVDKFASAEELNNYTKASHPSIWIFLSALLAVAVGFLIWTFVGDVAISVNGSTLVKDNVATIFLHSKDAEQVKVGQEVMINEVTSTIKEKRSESYQLTKEIFDDNKYLAELGEFSIGDWITDVYCEIKTSNGSYKAEITVERVKPIKFIFN